MKRTLNIFSYSFILLPILILFLLCGIAADKYAAYTSSTQTVKNQTCIIIDPGHGGEDGGAISCTGVYESQINLEISLKLNDLFRLLGYDTLILRTTNEDLHTRGDTISKRKMSDLSNRVRIIKEQQNALLVSIHQNKFIDSRYSGLQVFYASTPQSKELAYSIQNTFNNTFITLTHRSPKVAEKIYILEHIECTAVLIECGFLSNPTEEELLRSNTYQRKLCSLLCSVIGTYISETDLTIN